MKNTDSDTKKDLFAFISSFLAEDVNYEHFISYLKFGLNMQCSIQSQNPNDQINYLKRNSFVSKEDYMTFALGHISTDPQNAEHSFLLKNLYVYDENKQGNYNNEVINSSEENVIQFLNKLRDTCDSLKKSIANKEKINPQVFYVESARGAGKTFFLNHFFTRFNDSLAINDRILWIRVDLDLNFADSQIDIQRYIGAKLLKIILKHYCRNSKYNMSFFVSQIKQKIYDIPYVEDFFKEKLINKFYTLVAKFHNNQSWEGSYDSFDETLIDIMYNVLDINGYKTIFIIDNIDLLDKSNNRIEKFHFYLKQIKEQVIPSLRTNGVFIITYRSNIHSYLTKQIAASGGRIFATYHYRLNVVEFEKIFSRKEELLFERISSLGQIKSRNWDLSDWPEQLLAFRYFIMSASESKSMPDYLNFLETSFGCNNRAKTQMIQLLYQAFILSSNNKISYKFIEYLFLAGNRFPPKVFHYKYVSDKLFLDKAEKVYDNIFVPNLFVYPYHHNLTNFSIPYSQSYLLIKFRIIQLLLCASLNCLKKASRIKVDDITSLLKKSFNYDERIILLCLDEFFELELIKIEDEDNISLVSKNTQIEITQRFMSFFSELSNAENKEKTINYFNLFNGIAYLNLCAMRVDVACNAISDKGIFFSTPYDTITISKQQTLEWLMRKLVNSVLLMKYIIEIEKFENNYILANESLPEKIKEIINNFPKLSSLLLSNVEHQIKSSINNLDRKEQEIIEPQVRNHIEKLFSQQ